MDRIIFEVDDVAAKKWRYISQEKKAELTKAFNKILNTALDKNENDLLSFLDKVSNKAEANGLTEETLKELLNEG